MLIAMGTGMSFSNLVNLRLSQGEQGERFKALGLQRKTVSQIGDGVIALIWVTGLLLVWLIGGMPQSGWFHAKLAFVVLLTAAHFMARRTGGEMARTGNLSLMPRIQLFVGAVWVSALAAILLAVLAFH